MKHHVTTLIIFLFLGIVNNSFSQIIINQQDMPSANDTVRTSIITESEGFDFQTTGEDFSWDFSALEPVIQRLDTFKTVTQTPLVFWPSFMTTANLVIDFNALELFPDLPISRAYQFIKKSADAYSDYGYGIIIQDIPLPLRFSSADIIYKFPLSYGNSFESDAELEFSLPDMGYLSIDRHRENEVDGWGSLTTPYGTFDVIRVKSFVKEIDSLYLDTLGQGYAVSRSYMEYKWLAKNEKIPLLSVMDDPYTGVTVIYKDSIRDLTVGIQNEAKFIEFNVYPNPFQQSLTIQLDDNERDIEILISGTDGRVVYQTRINSTDNLQQSYSVQLPAELPAGIYFMQVRTGTRKAAKTIIKQ